MYPRNEEPLTHLSFGRTFKAVDTKEEIFKKLEYIASLLEHDLRVGGYEGKLFTLTYKEHTFKGLSICNLYLSISIAPFHSTYASSET